MSSTEAAQILQSLGLTKRLSRLLAHLAVHGRSTRKNVTKATKLQQSEVHYAGRTGQDFGWVTIETEHSERGRPHRVYSLAVPFSEILRQIEAEKMAEAVSAHESADRAKELA